MLTLPDLREPAYSVILKGGGDKRSIFKAWILQTHNLCLYNLHQSKEPEKVGCLGGFHEIQQALIDQGVENKIPLT